MTDLTYQIPDAVVEDTLAFRGEVRKYLSGETSAVAFRAIRVPMGIYEQRQNDTYMVRVRGAGGVFLPHQVERVAQLAQEFGSGIVHVTTRQDLQIHRVLIENAPAILEKLLEVGLSSRGGGGNTVRNVSACPLAGACADEVFDVTPYSIALTEYLIRDRANFNLPRKFKAAFSGCAKDCGLCSVADLGFFAHENDGERGFSVYAGGGMGAHSALGILIEEWIPESAIFEVAEAVKRLFDTHGDRTNRHKARLRFVLERVGADEFRRLYREELRQVRREELSFPKLPEAVAKSSLTHTVRIPLSLGDVQAHFLLVIARLIATVGDGTLRTTQDQDLQLRGVQDSELPRVHDALKEIDESLTAAPAVRTVACAGASTCKLGLCLSRGLAEAVESELRDSDASWEEPIRISGCPNSCGQHPIAPLGLYGSARRVNGRVVPYYALVVGGRTEEGNARLADLATRVPAKAVPSLLKEFVESATRNRREGESLHDLIDRWGADYLRQLGEQYQRVPAYEQDPSFYRDFGSDEDFSLAGRGPGECGAGIMDVVALDIDAAQGALEEGNLYDAVSSAARALLVTRGVEPKTDRQAFAAFSEHITTPGWVSPAAQEVVDAAIDVKMGDRDSLEDLRPQVAALVERVNELFHSLDANLNFRLEPISNVEAGEPLTVQEAVHELDLRGVACPMNFVRAKVHLEQFESGDALDILLDDGDPARNVPASFAEQGEEVVSVTGEGGHFRVRVRKTS